MVASRRVSLSVLLGVALGLAFLTVVSAALRPATAQGEPTAQFTVAWQTSGPLDVEVGKVLDFSVTFEDLPQSVGTLPVLVRLARSTDCNCGVPLYLVNGTSASGPITITEALAGQIRAGNEALVAEVTGFFVGPTSDPVYGR